MEFTLTFSDTGLRADSKIFSNLDEARDAAFDLSLENRVEISIVCDYGKYSEVVERVLA